MGKCWSGRIWQIETQLPILPTKLFSISFSYTHSSFANVLPLQNFLKYAKQMSATKVRKQTCAVKGFTFLKVVNKPSKVMKLALYPHTQVWRCIEHQQGSHPRGATGVSARDGEEISRLPENVGTPHQQWAESSATTITVSLKNTLLPW